MMIFTKKPSKLPIRSMYRVDLFREAIKTFVRVQTAKRLIALGASMPDAADVPRRGVEPAR
jgi:hypothetical protein